MHTHVQNVHTVVENNLKHYKELFDKICYYNTEKYPFVMATTTTVIISKKISSDKNVISRFQIWLMVIPCYLNDISLGHTLAYMPKV